MGDRAFVAIDLFGFLLLISAFGVQIYADRRRKRVTLARDENQPRVERISRTDQDKRFEPPHS
jgi:hypothetical protein